MEFYDCSFSILSFLTTKAGELQIKDDVLKFMKELCCLGGGRWLLSLHLEQVEGFDLDFSSAESPRGPVVAV